MGIPSKLAKAGYAMLTPDKGKKISNIKTEFW